MKKLELQIKKNGFIYNQVKRNEKCALYEQKDSEGNLVGHEVFKIKVSKAGEVFGSIQPEREVFPNNEDFGVTAWSVGKDIELAKDRLKNLDQQVRFSAAYNLTR